MSNPTLMAGTRSRLYNSTGFFFLCWAAHYLPFFLMGRQLFLHHYLPAHLASALVTGAVVEFVFNLDPTALEEPSYTTIPDGKGHKKKGSVVAGTRSVSAKERLGAQNLLATWAAAGVVMAVVIGGWYFFLPLTYGKPGLDVAQVNARKWLGYDLHFAK
jgi:dolichyl-phosphate-mannose-protein mannosyltransferase